jgi:DNA polymerase III alpha subunit
MTMRHWPDFNDKNPDEVLQELCRFAWARRNEPPGSPLRERVAAELKVIGELGYARMFLFLYTATAVQTLAGYVVCASGALAGSATAYLLGVSGINPLEHGLHFERFIHSRQKSPPTPALETSANGYSEILRALQRKISLNQVGVVHGQYWDYVYLSSVNIRLLCKADWELNSNLLHWKNLHLGIDWPEADKLGMLCIAIRKSKILTALVDALNDLHFTKRPDLSSISLADEKTYEFLNSTDADALFALRENNYIKKQRPDIQNFTELTAFLALDAPHEAEKHALYYGKTAKRTPGLELFPICQKHLRETRGVILYEEQFMDIVAEISGLPREDAFAAYRAAWKRMHRKVDEWKQRFIAGSLDNGYSENDISTILDDLFFAAREGLSLKAYFVGQAMQLYRLAYCKVHYG